METLVNYILCRSTRCPSVQNTYILSTPSGWLGGMLILMMKSPYAGFIGDFVIISTQYSAIKDFYLKRNKKKSKLKLMWNNLNTPRE